MRWFLIRAAGRAGGRVDGAPTTKGLHSGAHGAAEEGGDLAGVPAAAVMGLDRAQAGLTGSPASGFGGWWRIGIRCWDTCRRRRRRTQETGLENYRR